MTAWPGQDDAHDGGEQPTGPQGGGEPHPTDPMNRGGGEPTEPLPAGGEDPTEPLPGGDENVTEPLAEGNENATEPLAAKGGDPAGSSTGGPEAGEKSGIRILLGSIVAAVLLVGIYLAAGGLDFKPAAAADPCDARAWGDPQGLEQTAERFSLAALDGAACQLGVSREELTRALASEQSRLAFAEENGLSDSEIEDAIRSGLERAIDDGENAGAIGSLAATGLRLAVRVMPVGEMAYLALDATEVFQDGGFDGIGGVIDGALDALDGTGSGGSGSGRSDGGGSEGGSGSGGSDGGGSDGGGGGSTLDEFEKQFRKNFPDQVPDDLDRQIEKGLEGLLGP